MTFTKHDGKGIISILQADDIKVLSLKLAESIKNSEQTQVSRGETMNRLTQSLEESQKRCRNLLESSKSS